MKITFWLLDLNYELRENEPQLWLWGIDTAGKRVLIIDKNFQDYFYAVLKEGTEPETVTKTISKTDFPQITKTKTVDKKYFGKPAKSIKLYVQTPEVMAKYAKMLQKLEGMKECLEFDLRIAMRYLIDNDVVPCGWHTIEAQASTAKVKAQVDAVYEAKNPPVHIVDPTLPKLRILGFSIVSYSEKGTAKPDENPVVIISLATNTHENSQFTAQNEDDKAIIMQFLDYTRKFDPDVIVGFGSNSHDWNYLLTRAKKYGITLNVDRTDAAPHTSVYGHVSLTGRANIDWYDYADELPEVKLKTLENIADYLEAFKREKRTLIDEAEIPTYWQAKRARPELQKFSKENTLSIMGITDAMLDFAIQLSALVGLPLDHVGTAAVGFRTEWYLTREAFKIDELIPKRQERPYIPYAGGMVTAPKPGMHENIAVLDFKSMYPNIMIAYNISPDTYVSKDEPEPKSGVFTAPEVKHRFRKEPPGFYKKVLISLIQARDEIRLRLTKLTQKSPEARALDARQKAVKVITNACYGYTGWLGARWYVKPVAEAAAAWGRDTIQKTIKQAHKLGLQVIYSDTDSVFVANEPAKISRLSQEVGKTLGLEIKPDKVYTRVLFTEAKKRYCGLLPDGQLDTVGLEVVRGDWTAVARNLQAKVLEILLKEKSPEKAADYVRQFIYDVKAGKIPYREFVIWKTLTKAPEEYAVKAPHVEAARLLKNEGLDLTLGDKIGYVIVKGEGKLYARAKPYMLATEKDLDTEYYITNQVVPAAARVLSVFGVGEEELHASKELKSTSEKTLSEYMPEKE